MVGTFASAQQQQDFSQVQIKATKLADNFYMLEGQGGQIGVLTGPDGVFMVDTQFAPLSDKIAAAVKQITTSPIKFVVNTHVHGDHTWKRELRQDGRDGLFAGPVESTAGGAGSKWSAGSEGTSAAHYL